MGRLDGKVAIITGAASGMGRESALLFAREGAKVIAADLNVEGGEETAVLASKSGGHCIFQRTDVSSEDDVASLVKRASDEFGRLDILFNNAGLIGAVGPLENIEADDWDRTQAVLLRGAYLGIKHAAPVLRASGGGAIISTSSVSGFYAYPNLHAYGSAKAGLIQLTKSTAIQYGQDSIRVNCISPGNIVTPIIGGLQGLDAEAVEKKFGGTQPIPRPGVANDIAQAALFLASDEAGFITGHNLVVDGGMTLGMGLRSPPPDLTQPQTGARFVGPSFGPD
ncbi:MAG: SDR family oxidoreductase [Sphingomonadaceae bacterium]|nr:SDR family oxidoreductase [Sphingomonadaceae bacterium]